MRFPAIARCAQSFRTGAASAIVFSLAGCGTIADLRGLIVDPPAPTAPVAAGPAATLSSPSAQGGVQQPSTPAQRPSPGNRMRPFADVVKDAKATPGYFTVWRDDDKAWIELRPEQLGKPFFFTNVLSSGLAQFPFVPGMMGDGNVAEFRRIGDRIQLVALNTGFRSETKSPLARALDASVSDSLLSSVPIASAEHPERRSILIDAGALLLGDLSGISTAIEATFRLSYGLDRANSTIEQVNGSGGQTALGVRLHYALPKLPVQALAPGKPAPPDSIPDPRSFFLGVLYRFAPLPEQPMDVRLADERVGYFVTDFRDLRGDYAQDIRVRMINRWRLEKKDPAAAISEPRQPIVAYLDRNIPVDLRPAVESGVLEWNKAFEAAGFRNAIVVRQQPDGASWETLEGRHIAVKWFVDTSIGGTAIGPRQVDPRTGEILHASVLIPDARARLLGRRYGEILPTNARQQLARLGRNADETCTDAFDSLEHSAFAFDLMVERGGLTGDTAASREFIHASIKRVVMHETGHALGLRHNFKGSSAFNEQQLRDARFTANNGLSASVMDYVPENIPLEGDQKAGTLVMGTIGAYDTWAIEYGYRVYPADREQAALQQLASKSATDKRLAYATDEDAGSDTIAADLPMGIDPLTNRYDLGDEPLVYFERQFLLARELWRRTVDRKLDPEDDYQVYRRNLSRGLSQMYFAAPGIAKYVGGVYVNRDRAGSGRALLTPVEPERQRAALKLLTTQVFDSASFKLDPQFMRRLGIDQFERRGAAGVRSPDFSLPSTVLAIQRSALDPLMSDGLAQRLADAESKSSNPRELVSYAEVQRALTDAIWSELRSGRDIDSLRRTLQREHLRRLAGSLLRPAPGVAADVRAVIRQEAQRLLPTLDKAQKNKELSAVARAHVSESAEIVREALAAPMYKQGV